MTLDQAEQICVEWPKCKNRHGYGVVLMWGKMRLVHRLVYRMYHQLSEEKMPPVVRHTCDNPSCYRIDHLIGGNQQDNVNDAVSMGRHARGSAHGNAKINERDAFEIKARLLDGDLQETLANDYGVSTSTISDIKMGKKWKHVDCEVLL